MDDKIVFSEFAEIDLRAVSFGTTQPRKPSRVDCEASEQLRSRENDQIRRWKTKSAREGTLDEIDPLNCPLHDFAEPLDLAFSLKINYDSGVVRAPFFQALDELSAFCLGQHEIAGAKLSNLTILKRAAKIFRTGLNPGFADLKVRARQRRRICSRLNLDNQIALAKIVANKAALVLYRRWRISRSPRRIAHRRSLIQQNID